MANKGRLLVVEDMENEREIYAAALRQESYQVDTAGDLTEATHCVHVRTYHVVLVDIMLGGPRNTANTDGLNVLKQVRDLNEGTRAIVVSGQTEKRAVYDILREYAAFDYIFKEEELAAEGLQVLVEKVAKAMESFELRKYGQAHDILSFLAGPGNEDAWVYKCLTNLKPKGAFEGLLHFFDKFCQPLLPLMPAAALTKAPTSVSERDRCVTGQFWSKGIGLPVEILVVPSGDVDRLQAQNQNGSLAGKEVLEKCERHHLVGFALKLESAQRGEFVDGL